MVLFLSDLNVGLKKMHLRLSVEMVNFLVG